MQQSQSTKYLISLLSIFKSFNLNILLQSHHCLLNGPASLKLARQHQLEERPLEYFVTEMVKEELKHCTDYGDSINQFFDSHE